MWTNWAGDQRCEPAAVERPAAVGEVVGAVERAVAAGRGVRVAGSGHSFTAAALTDGTLLSLDRMGALLDADPGSGLVRVEAGIAPARPQRGAGRARAGDAQPGRHRRAVDRRRDLDRHARHRRHAAQPLRAGARAAPGHRVGRRASRSTAARTCSRRASRSARWGSSPRSRCRRCPPSRCAASTRRWRWPRSSTGSTRASTGHRHFEFFVFPHADSALTRTNDVVDEPPQPAAAAGAPRSTTSCWPTAPSSWRASSAARSRARSRRSTAS